MHIINSYFDHVYLINLDRRKDRLESATAQLNSLGIEYERVSAVDSIEKNIPPTQACTMSHLMVIKDAKKRGFNNIVIFEDDVVFVDDFTEKFNVAIQSVPSTWEMLYIGGVNFDYKKINMHVVSSNGTHATHAYAIKGQVFDKILNTVKEEDVVDVSYAKMHKDMETYSIKPSLCTQSPGVSDIDNCYVDYKDLFS